MAQATKNLILLILQDARRWCVRREDMSGDFAAMRIVRTRKWTCMMTTAEL